MTWPEAYQTALRMAVSDPDPTMQRIYGEIALAIQSRSRDAKDCIEVMSAHAQRRAGMRYH